MSRSRFRKVLAPYYHKWLRDCFDSVVYCEERGDMIGAQSYLISARNYFQIINENWDAIEFFSIGDNAFKIDTALPEEFRGYD